MNRFLVFISVILATTIGNISNAVAQAHSKLEGTIWEYVWDDEMRRDFIAFVSDDKALSYSLEVDEFEISDYYINDDTIIVTTSDIDNTHNERPIVSTIYYFKNENDFLVLLFVIFKYEDGYIRKTPIDPYKLYKKK